MKYINKVASLVVILALNITNCYAANDNNNGATVILPKNAMQNKMEKRNKHRQERIQKRNQHREKMMDKKQENMQKDLDKPSGRMMNKKQ
jgi:hypothetical protein